MAKREEEIEYRFKVLLTGDSRVGKSSIFSRFGSNNFCLDYKPTIMGNFASRTFKIKSDVVKVQLWDTAGQEEFWSLTKSFFRRAHGIVLVYDVTNPSSFNNLRRWLDMIRCHDITNLVILLVGNKTDLEHLRRVEREAAATFANEERLLFVETSALDATNVGIAFEVIASEMHSIFGRKLLSSSADQGLSRDIKQGQAITVSASETNGKVTQCCLT